MPLSTTSQPQPATSVAESGPTKTFGCDAVSRQRVAQGRLGRGISNGHHVDTEPRGLRGEHVDATPAGRQTHDPETVGRTRDHVDRLGPDGPGGSQDHDVAHAFIVSQRTPPEGRPRGIRSNRPERRVGLGVDMPAHSVSRRRRTTMTRLAVALVALAGCIALGPSATAVPAPMAAAPSAVTAAADARPNIFFYNLDDLRDALPGGIDPLQFMPKVRQWMAVGTRYTQHFVAEPSCCPSRSSLMTGRYPHNNGDPAAVAGTELRPRRTRWRATCRAPATRPTSTASSSRPGRRRRVPPCFDHSTVMWGGYNNVATKVDGVSKKSYRLLDDRARRARPRVRHPGARERQAVPPLRDPAGPALGGRHRVRRHRGASRGARHEVRERPSAAARACRSPTERQAGLRAQPELHDRAGAR